MSKNHKANIARITAIEPICVECGGKAKTASGERIYPHRPDLYHKTFWLCECGAYCGSHPGTGTPLGKPAGPKTRAARSRAHAAFDPLWKTAENRGHARGSAYKALAKHLGIPPEDCHIGWMDATTADRVPALVSQIEADARAAREAVRS